MGKWIAETDQERRRLEAPLGRTATTRLTAEDFRALVASLEDITATLAAADPADTAKVYTEIGIDITYHQDGRVAVDLPHEFLLRRNSKAPATGGTRCRRSVPPADYTDAGAGDVVLSQLTTRAIQPLRPPACCT